MQPSRTYTIAVVALVILALVAVGLFVVALLEPRALANLGEPIGTLVLAVAGVATSGAGAMAVRDASSGGLTSSQGDRVLAARRVRQHGEPTPPPAAG